MARTRTRNVNENNSDEKKAAVSDRRRRKSDSADANNNAVENVSARKERPTPTRQQKPRGKGLLSRIPVVRGIVGYIRGVTSEMQKVTWPSREETTRLTGVVLGVTIAFAIGLGLLDTFFAWWFRQAFSTDSEIIFLGVAAVMIALVGGGYAAFRNRI